MTRIETFLASAGFCAATLAATLVPGGAEAAWSDLSPLQEPRLRKLCGASALDVVTIESEGGVATVTVDQGEKGRCIWRAETHPDGKPKGIPKEGAIERGEPTDTAPGETTAERQEKGTEEFFASIRERQAENRELREAEEAARKEEEAAREAAQKEEMRLQREERERQEAEADVIRQEEAGDFLEKHSFLALPERVHKSLLQLRVTDACFTLAERDPVAAYTNQLCVDVAFGDILPER